MRFFVAVFFIVMVGGVFVFAFFFSPFFFAVFFGARVVLCVVWACVEFGPHRGFSGGLFGGCSGCCFFGCFAFLADLSGESGYQFPDGECSGWVVGVDGVLEGVGVGVG